MRGKPDAFYARIFGDFLQSGTITHHARKNSTSNETLRARWFKLELITREELSALEVERFAIAKELRTKQGHDARRKQIQREAGKTTGLNCKRCGILYEYGGNVDGRCIQCAEVAG